MVRHYYVDSVTDFSEKELEKILQTVETPVCLLGGWAVHLHVNPGFQDEHGREYIGSRDIDIGFHISPDWTEEELENSPVGRSLDEIEDLGYNRSRFGFVKTFDRETGETLTQEEAKELPLHRTFEVFIDIIPDTDELETFEDVFGFRPPSEPLLMRAFENSSEPLSRYVDWGVDRGLRITEPALLAAMKVRSIPDRDKDHKRVKDLADLYALLWYVKDYSDMKQETLSYVSDEDLNSLEDSVDQDVFEDASNLIQVEGSTLRNAVMRLST